MENIITAISKFAPKDISMDFEQLRQEGILHLEDLATYIWTDFNVHDPGITILEVLCYAITDLGYRANLPIEDILANEQSNGDPSFFTAAEILPISPVTPTDLRKVIIDFPGVRNAWVEKALTDRIKIYVKKVLIDRDTADIHGGFIDSIEGGVDAAISRLEDLIEKLEDDEGDKIQIIKTQLEGIKEILEDFTFEGDLNNLDNLRADFDRLDNLKTELSSIILHPLPGINAKESEYWQEIRSQVSNILADLVELGALYIDYFDRDQKYYESSFRQASKKEIDDLLAAYSFQDTEAGDDDLQDNVNTEIKKLVEDPGALSIDDLLPLVEKAFQLDPYSVEDVRQIFDLVEKVLCRYRYFELINEENFLSKIKREELEPDNYQCVSYNGLYRICIDPHLPLEPDSKAARRLVEKIRKGYYDEPTGKQYKGFYEYRNLGEDFLDIKVAPIQEINLCLDITIEEEADEKEVMAEVIFRLQSFLTPTVPFYTFQQLLEKGLSCDAIFNGPLLCNGFIDDEELESATIPAKIQLSDLYKIILETPHVQKINHLKTKVKELDTFLEEWCIKYDPKADPDCLTKPIIDLSDSLLCVRANGISKDVTESDIEDLIQLLQLGSRNLVGRGNGMPKIPRGRYREDLNEFISTQFEFPHNYAVGDNGLPDEASPQRRAQVRQLQAFLLFFDRLLADYLQQLSKVRDLLSVQQDPVMATYFFQALYEIPGVRELINDGVFEITAGGIERLQQQGVPDNLLDVLRDAEGNTYIGQVRLARAMGGKPDNPADNGLLGASWLVYQNKICEAFLREFSTDEEWKQYREDDQNFYMQELRRIAETEDGQFRRKHRLINHLLARFGESFTAYAAKIFGNRASHLQAKAGFLKSVPVLGLERARGYNHRAKDPEVGDPDVWNTDNVAGLKKRIYSLLGWGQATTESVLVDPNFLLLDEEDLDSEMLPLRYIKLFKRGEGGVKEELLLTSEESYSIRRVKDLIHQLHVYIDNGDNYKVEADGEDFSVVFEATVEVKEDKENIRLVSIPLSKKDAESFLEYIQELVAAKIKGGFHLIEHILLRPNDSNDRLLQMGFTCDLSTAPTDPYSFWVSVLAPAWIGKFQDAEYRHFFMNLLRREAPAHIILCFRWVQEEDTMQKLEDALEQWREALAECTPDECEITEKANALIQLLNAVPCNCYCMSSETTTPKC